MLKLEFLGRQGLGRIPLRMGLPSHPLTQNEAHRAFLAASPLALAPVKQVVDVGPASWFYLRALHEACPAAQIDGVEVDPYRRFQDFYRRVDHARAQIQRSAPTARYWTVDFLSPRFQAWYSHQDPASTLTTFFFPLVFAKTARQWGLPGGAIRWQEQLPRALEHSRQVLVTHADSRELEATQMILEGSGFQTHVARVTVPSWSRDPVWVVSVTRFT